LRQCGLAEHPAQRRVEQAGELGIRAIDRADRLIEFQHILDAVAGEGIDHEPLLVRCNHFLRGILKVENPIVDVDDGVDQRDLVVQPGLGDHFHRLAQPHHQRLAGLIDRKQGAIGDDQPRDDKGGDDAANETEPHRPPPVCGAVVGGRRVS
jgi:hypothetical protein